MTPLLRIAWRNLARNRRRSAATIGSIAIGAAAMLCFGQFVAQTVLEFQTGVVRNTGHLAVFRKGYYDFGGGNPAAYGISGYPALIAAIERDPELGPRLAVVTPRIDLNGVAGNFRIGASKTFFGAGVVPSDFTRMRQWDGYRLFERDPVLTTGLDPADPNVGVVGVGVARILGLCGELHVANCPAPPVAVGPETTGPAPDLDLADLARRDAPQGAAANATNATIDLLTATASGAPNVATLRIAAAESQGIRELDDNYVRLHFDLAQQLLYGRTEPRAVSIVIQLKRTQDLAAAKARLETLIAERGLELEVRDFRELNPFYAQGSQFLTSLFVFMAIIMGVIVLFTVVNTMSMTVLERTHEIGAARSMGWRRSAIRWQFILEGVMLGGLGVAAGLVAAQALGVLINLLHIRIVLPGSAQGSELRLLTNMEVVPLMLGVSAGLLVMAVAAAFAPANRAARMLIVDALRHV
jgi:putative ABC transport system permease protein